MSEPVDPKKFGQRVRELREELGWNQERLGKQAGFSQSNIGWIESGGGKDPKKQALALADALGSTPSWLLYGTGDRETGLRPMTREQLSALYDDLPLSVRLVISETVKAAAPAKAGPSKKRASK